jgi:Protein of unknown function (DUF3302)
MTGLDIFAFFILLVSTVVVVVVFYSLASWPGRVARSRNHPNAQAIEVGGWATLVFGAVFWPVVLIWAYRNFETSDNHRG